MKEILKSKNQEIYKLGQSTSTNIIDVYQGGCQENQEIKRAAFFEVMANVYPRLFAQNEDEKSCYDELQSKDLNSLKCSMLKVVKLLPDRKRGFLVEYLGLDENLPMNCKQIANKHNLNWKYVFSAIDEAIVELWNRETAELFLQLLGLSKRKDHYIKHLQLSTRTRNALCRNGIHTLEKLSTFNQLDLLKWKRGFGGECLKEITSVMNDYGFSFSNGEKQKNF